MDDLYSDNDPDYRATRLHSEISPPSSRDQPYIRQQHQHQAQRQSKVDLSRYNPALQQPHYSHHHQNKRPSYQPYQQQRFAPYGQQPPLPHQQQLRNQQQQQPFYKDQRGNYCDQHQHAYDLQQQQEVKQSAQPQPTSRKAKPIDLKTNTDFLACKRRLSLENIVQKVSIVEENVSNIDYEFVSSTILVKTVNEARAKMSHVTKEALSTARSRSNPFERIGTSVFMNRAAVKLAALDATFGLTQKEDATSTFTFADLCGGPGGFTEYLLWRIHSWGETAHGYGITLQSTEHDEVNWQLDKFKQLAPEGSFTIVEGMDGTGDLYKEANIRHFETMVTESNHCKEGVDLVVADGGFDFSGAEGEQEIVAYRLILCEITTMLTCLKQGGHFVCKFFDMLSQSTVSLVWLLYQLFDEVCITKPLSSRPANAERYIVCKGLVHKRPAELVTKLLQMIQRVFNTTNNIKAFSLIERSVMEEDEEFIDYVQMRNMKIAMKQTEALELMNQYIQNPEASPSYDQEQIRRHLLNEWRLPSPN